ncbi:MAG: hypothetical protein KatS3mg105_4048 [Gemmatales bacterium]|nr:MAG: hypothetical protein KatS3mg105_4048 [Gemmatales bacterium]
MRDVSTLPGTVSRKEELAERKRQVFCSGNYPEIFHAIVHKHEIWKHDPFDVESIHEEARAVFNGLLMRATSDHPSAGRIFTLLGESGCGKTHLMRAFRNEVHERELGYVGYMTMTSTAEHYDRYILSNLIDSLDQPFLHPEIPASGLARLSKKLFDALPIAFNEQRQKLREEEIDSAQLGRLVRDMTLELERSDPRFSDIGEPDVLSALLYLQRDDPPIKSRVLKYLRCEDLNAFDRQMLGDLVPRCRPEDPLRMIRTLGKLIHVLERSALVLLVDQMEDMTDQETRDLQAAARFRRAIDTLCAVIDEVPSAVVVIACLEDYFKNQQPNLAKSKLDRLVNDPKQTKLNARRSLEEIKQLLARRLRYLFDESGLVPNRGDDIFPYRDEDLIPLTNLRIRDILDGFRRHREECIFARAWKAPIWQQQPKPPSPPTRNIERIEQEWNDFRARTSASPPDAEKDLAELLGWAISQSGAELAGYHFEIELCHDYCIRVLIHEPDNDARKLFVAVCNKKPQGKWLMEQIENAEGFAHEDPLAIVRSTPFPQSPNAKVMKKVAAIITRGGRRVVIEDSDWRTMLALRAFLIQHKKDDGVADWLRESRPLTTLPSLQTLLDLDNGPATPAVPPTAANPPSSSSDDQPTAAKPAEQRNIRPPVPTGSLLVGTTTGIAPQEMTLNLSDLTQHIAFLGTTGSGKTTAALNLIEQLLLQGVPAVLVDRKGDLCGYADPSVWNQTMLPDESDDRKNQLREKVDVAIFTPGHSDGRPLDISLVPDGTSQMTAHEQDQIAGFAATALGSMMRYRTRTDQKCHAVLRQAITLLIEQGLPVTLPQLIDMVTHEDPSLITRVGSLGNHFRKLAQDLQTLQINQNRLLQNHGEKLSIDLLLGRGPFAIPGKTRLSIISTKFLGDNIDIQFWITQLLLEITRWGNQNPHPELQAVFMFDEADLYLPAQRQPATKAPMENLLKRIRSAGVGIMLATQSPGDLDYRCREMIGTWLAGRITQNTALEKLKPMFAQYGAEQIASKLPAQPTGHFYLIRSQGVTPLKAKPSFLRTRQLAEEEILALAANAANRCHKA